MGEIVRVEGLSTGGILKDRVKGWWCTTASGMNRVDDGLNPPWE